MSEKQSYTIADLLAMPDDALNALAAELRGYTLSKTKIFWRDANEEVICHRRSFAPATDRNQIGELFDWAVKEHDMGFMIRIGGGYPRVVCLGDAWITIKGNSARAKTAAFCAAMLAQAGRLTQ